MAENSQVDAGEGEECLPSSSSAASVRFWVMILARLGQEWLQVVLRQDFWPKMIACGCKKEPYSQLR